MLSKYIPDYDNTTRKESRLSKSQVTWFSILLLHPIANVAYSKLIHTALLYNINNIILYFSVDLIFIIMDIDNASQIRYRTIP